MVQKRSQLKQVNNVYKREKNKMKNDSLLKYKKKLKTLKSIIKNSENSLTINFKDNHRNKYLYSSYNEKIHEQEINTDNYSSIGNKNNLLKFNRINKNNVDSYSDIGSDELQQQKFIPKCNIDSDEELGQQKFIPKSSIDSDEEVQQQKFIPKNNIDSDCALISTESKQRKFIPKNNIHSVSDCALISTESKQRKFIPKNYIDIRRNFSLIVISNFLNTLSEKECEYNFDFKFKEKDAYKCNDFQYINDYKFLHK